MGTVRWISIGERHPGLPKRLSYLRETEDSTFQSRHELIEWRQTRAMPSLISESDWGDYPRPGHRSFTESPVPALSTFPRLTGSALGSRAQEHTSLAAPQHLPRVEAARDSGDPRRRSCRVHLRPASTFLRLDPAHPGPGNQEGHHLPGGSVAWISEPRFTPKSPVLVVTLLLQ